MLQILLILNGSYTSLSAKNKKQKNTPEKISHHPDSTNFIIFRTKSTITKTTRSLGEKNQTPNGKNK